MTKQIHNIKTKAHLHDDVVAIWSMDTNPPYPVTPDLLMPDGYIQLLFVLSGGYKQRKLSKTQEHFVINQSVLIGLQDKVIMSQGIGELQCIGIQFDPMQFYILFGDLGAKAYNSHLPIEDLSHAGLVQLNEKISRTNSIAEALKEIEYFIDTYQPKNVKCETWQITQKYLESLRNKKDYIASENITNFDTVEAKTLSTHIKNFTGFSLEEMNGIIKIANSHSEISTNESKAKLSIEELFKDIDDSQKEEQG